MQVWDVSKQEPPIANFRGHHKRVISCAWNIEKGTLLSGSEDQCVRTWDILKAEYTHPPENKAQQIGNKVIKKREVFFLSDPRKPKKHVQPMLFEEKEKMDIERYYYGIIDV